MSRLAHWIASLVIVVACHLPTAWGEGGSVAAPDDAQFLQQAIDQSRHGDWNAAAQRAAEINDPHARAVSLAAVRQRSLDRVSPGEAGDQASHPRGSKGGGSQADFTSLINLIEDTIAPDSWEETGTGDGKISSFTGGVYVDAQGVLQEALQNSAPSFVPSTSVMAAARHGQRKEPASTTRASIYRVISLPRLERQLQLTWALQQQPTAELRYLAGMDRLYGVFAYPETGEIVLLGSAPDMGADTTADTSTDTEPTEISARGRPCLRLDDLVVHLRLAASGGKPFGCSITPLKDNLARTQDYLDETGRRPLRPGQSASWLAMLRERLGMQRIEIFGVDPTTQVARVLVEADYHMKRIAMGLEEGTTPDFGYLAHLTSTSAKKLDVLRWWFSLDYDALMYSPDHNAFGWQGTGVRVDGENEFLAANGKRMHSGRMSDPTASFAERFTREFAQLAEMYPIYADLQNQFALALASASIVAGDLTGRCGWTPTLIGPKGSYAVEQLVAPTEVASIVNHRRLGRGVIVAGVSGGVRAEPQAALHEAKASDAKALERLEKLHEAARPPSSEWQQWHWDITIR